MNVMHRLLTFRDETKPIGPLEHPWISVEPSHMSFDRGVVGGCLRKEGILADNVPIRVHIEVGEVDWAVLIERIIADHKIAGCKVVGGSLVGEWLVWRIVQIFGIVTGQVDKLTEVAIG